jgi:hypothetical protein
MSRRPRFRFAAIARRALVLALLGATGRAAAQRGVFSHAPGEGAKTSPQDPGPLTLTWSAPAGCPAKDLVNARIFEHLGREGIVPDPEAGLVARAKITEAGDRYELELELETPRGATKLEAGDPVCEVLAELVAIKVSLALDPVETARQLLPEDEHAPEPEPSREETRPALLLQAAALVGGGTLSSVEAGGSLGLGITDRMWKVTLGVSSSSGPRQELAEPPGGRVGMVAIVGDVTGCVLPVAGRVGLPACMGIDAGVVRGRGIDLATNRVSWRSVLGVAVETGISWPQDRSVRLLIRARARTNVLRPSFAVTDVGVVHRADVVAGQALLGMEAVLGRR